MKKIAISLVLAASLLSACTPKQVVAPGEPVESDDANECPRADGTPCK